MNQHATPMCAAEQSSVGLGSAGCIRLAREQTLDVACNASKGTKDLAVWLESNYCRTRGITAESFAPVVRADLKSRVSKDVP